MRQAHIQTYICFFPSPRISNAITRFLAWQLFTQWQLDWKREDEAKRLFALHESKMKFHAMVFFAELRCNNLCDVCFASAKNRYLSSGDMSENAAWRDTISMYHEEDTSPWTQIHGFHKERALWDCFLIETIALWNIGMERKCLCKAPTPWHVGIMPCLVNELVEWQLSYACDAHRHHGRCGGIYFEWVAPKWFPLCMYVFALEFQNVFFPKCVSRSSFRCFCNLL